MNLPAFLTVLPAFLPSELIIGNKILSVAKFPSPNLTSFIRLRRSPSLTLVLTIPNSKYFLYRSCDNSFLGPPNLNCAKA